MPSSQRRKREREKLLTESSRGNRRLCDMFASKRMRLTSSGEVDVEDRTNNPTMSTSDDRTELAQTTTETVQSNVSNRSSETVSCNEIDNLTTNSPDKENAVPPQSTNRKHRRSVQSILELNFPWVMVKTETTVEGASESVLYCSLCQKHNVHVNAANGKGTWNTEGYRCLRKDKVKQHSESDQHKKAIQLDIERDNITVQADKYTSQQKKCVSNMMEIMRYLADKNHALEEFSSLVDLNLRLGCADLRLIRQSSSATYSSPQAVGELLQSLSDSTDEHVLSDIQKSPSYSILLDEVADVSVTKNLGVIVKYITEDGCTKMKFLADIEMSRSTGSVIKEEIIKVLEFKGLNPKCCSSVTSDGAASFLGPQSGAGVLLQRYIGPLIVMHCHDHRLALACRDAFKVVPKLDKVSEGLEALYKYYEYSTLSASTLRELQDLYRQSHWRVQQAKHHRWLSYDKTVTSVLKGYSVLVQDLENASVSNEHSKHRQTDAAGLAKWIQSELTIRTLALLGDLLPHLAELSLVFQQRQVDLSTIEPLVNKTLSVMKNMKARLGPWQKKLAKGEFLMRTMNCDDRTFEREIKYPLINSLCSKVSERFANVEIVSNLAVLAIPIQDPEVTAALPIMYKEREIEAAAAYFHLDESATVEEWFGWVEFLKGLDLPMSPRWQTTLPFLSKLLLNRTCVKSASLRELYPNLTMLYSVASTLSLSSAEVERLFSHLKLIKSDRRASLSNLKLNYLLNVKLNLEDDLWESVKTDAVNKWLSSKSSGRRLFSIH